VNSSPDSLISLGVVGKRRGLAGELRFKCWNAASTTLDDVTAVTLRSKDGRETRREIEALTWSEPGYGFVRFRGVTDANGAEALLGHEICVSRADLPRLEDGEHYHFDLVGLTAFDESGAELGPVTRVIAYPSVDCLVVEATDGDREVPMVPPYLVSIDVPSRKFVVGEWTDLEVIKRAPEVVEEPDEADDPAVSPEEDPA
jgi:16S rRNA processing protein RimM